MLEGFIVGDGMLIKHEDILKRNFKLNNGWHMNTSLALVVLSVSSVCNRSCEFCPISKNLSIPERVPDFISIETVKLLGKQLGEKFNGVISISGFGEPTLCPNLISIITELGTMCPNCKIILTTNGDYLTDDIISLKYLAKIIISAYAVQELAAFRKEYSDVKKVEILDRTVTGNFRFNNRGGNVYALNNKAKKKYMLKICSAPFFRINVDTDGSVYRCSCDWKRKYPLGNIYDKDIGRIFIEDLNKLRIKMLRGNRFKMALCNKCDVGYLRYHLKGLRKIYINGWEEIINNKLFMKKAGG